MDHEIEAEILEKAKDILKEDNLSLAALYGGNSLSINFCLLSADGKRYVVKLSNKKERMSRFALYKSLYTYGAAVVNPIAEFAAGAENNSCTIFEWVDGKTLNECIASEKYSVYFLAKTVCKAIHSVHRYNSVCFLRQPLEQEIDSYISYIIKHEIRFPHINCYLRMVQDTEIQAAGTFGCVHMDFHTKNVIVNAKDQAVLIDCENMMISEPWRDFVYAVAFHDGEEDLFWISLLLEYFNYSIPDKFWETIKFYSVLQLFRMIICNYKQGDYCMIERLSESLFATYNGFSDSKPTWMKKYLLRTDQIVARLGEANYKDCCRL